MSSQLSLEQEKVALIKRTVLTFSFETIHTVSYVSWFGPYPKLLELSPFKFQAVILLYQVCWYTTIWGNACIVPYD